MFLTLQFYLLVFNLLNVTSNAIYLLQKFGMLGIESKRMQKNKYTQHKTANHRKVERLYFIRHTKLHFFHIFSPLHVSILLFYHTNSI